MGKFFRRLGTACAAGLVSYAFPRLLIAVGVPLDVWIVTMGTVLDLSPDWVNFDTATWIITLVFGLALFGIEEWWHPFRKIWQFLSKRQNRIKKKERVASREPYQESWEGNPAPTVGQASYLWHGIEPSPRFDHGTPEYQTLQSFKSDVDLGNLVPDIPAGKIIDSRLSRETLRTYALSKNERPKFLFSEAEPQHDASESLSWFELEQRFRELENPLQVMRIDGQTGAAGEHWSLAGSTGGDAGRRFNAIAAMAGTRLSRDFPSEVSRYPDIQSESDPTIRWYKALKFIGDRYEMGHYAEQINNDGSPGGFIYSGSIQQPATASATLCLELASRPIEQT